VLSPNPGHRVLVVGSYPPIPRPAAEATVAAVRRAWANGDEVTVVSPRLSAADLAVPVVGLLAGRRLTNLRRHTETSRLVMVLESGVPLPVLRSGHPVGPPYRNMVARSVDRFLEWLHQSLTVEAMRRALGGFEHITFVRVGELAISPSIEARLISRANEVVDHPISQSLSPEAVGVTAFGPVEVALRERPRQIAGALARRLLGPYARPLRARAGAIRRFFRRY
jgi:hypothetical protein